MILSFHPCFAADVQIILGDQDLGPDGFELIETAKAIILPQGRHAGLYDVCSSYGALIFPNYEMRFKYPGKTGQARLFRDFSCSHPETLCWKAVKEFKSKYPVPGDFPHDLPFMIKDNKSHEAEGVYLINDSPSLAKALEQLEYREMSGMPGFVTQACIASDGNVLRVVIIGENILTYWKRPNRPGQFITTISLGAIIDHQWQPELQEKGNTRARALARKTGINLAAIDFVFDMSAKDPEPLFLEINYYFGRRGLGGTEKYYMLLYQAIQYWLKEAGLNPKSVRLV